MPTTVEEKFGRRLSETQAEMVYLVRGTTDQATARAALAVEAPPTFQGLERADVEVTELEGVAGGAFMGSARYSKSAPAQVNDSSFSFETGGGNTHIKASLATVGAYGTGASTSDNGNLIGATEEGVEGTDIVTPVYTWSETHWFDPTDITVPVYTFSETHHFDDSTVTNANKSTLFYLTGKTNDADFKGTSAGETLFLGAAGTQRGTDPWEIQFLFASTPNKTGITIGDITNIAKKGWEYLWVRHRQKELTGSLKLVTQQPVAVYVERVYEAGDLSGLGIGT